MNKIEIASKVKNRLLPCSDCKDKDDEIYDLKEDIKLLKAEIKDISSYLTEAEQEIEELKNLLSEIEYIAKNR